MVSGQSDPFPKNWTTKKLVKKSPSEVEFNTFEGDFEMTKQFTEEQIIYALRQADSGTSVAEVCRKMGIAEQTFYRWKKKFAGLGVSELRRLKQLEEENKKLKTIVADLTLDKQMLQDVLRKKF